MPDHLRAGRRRAALSHRSARLSPRLRRRARLPQRQMLLRHRAAAWACLTAGRCSSPITRSAASIRAASRIATPTTGSRTCATCASTTRTAWPTPTVTRVRRRTAGGSPPATIRTATARMRPTTTTARSRRPRRSRACPTRREEAMQALRHFLGTPARGSGALRLRRRVLRAARLVCRHLPGHRPGPDHRHDRESPHRACCGSCS